MQTTFPQPVVLTAEQAIEIMGKVAERVLKCSAYEFLERWDAGEFRHDDRPELAELAALIPFVR